MTYCSAGNAVSPDNRNRIGKSDTWRSIVAKPMVNSSDKSQNSNVGARIGVIASRTSNVVRNEGTI